MLNLEVRIAERTERLIPAFVFAYYPVLFLGISEEAGKARLDSLGNRLNYLFVPTTRVLPLRSQSKPGVCRLFTPVELRNDFWYYV